MRENRELPETPAPEGGAGRSEKAQRLKSDMHVSGKSDDLIVPTKRANDVAPAARSRYCDTRKRKGEPTVNTNIDLHHVAAAESVEGRGSTKGNDLAAVRVPDTEPGGRGDRLEAVRQASA